MRCMGAGIFWPIVKIDMEMASQTSFGRLDQCGLTADTHDKWDLLAALTLAAPEFDLGHRTLGVLKALLTFLPGRGISPARHSAIVFPSNRKLSERLNGMPESTLRRHLSRLAELGIVCRRSSPNGKRYARGGNTDCQLAFGFDLSPLAVHAGQIQEAAEAAKRRAEQLAMLRDEVAVLRQQLLETAPDQTAELLENVRKLLRRKPCETSLTRAKSELQREISRYAPAARPAPSPLSAKKMSGSSSQNERHIQNSNKYDSDSEEALTASPEQNLQAPSPQARTAGKETSQETGSRDLATLQQACLAMRDFYPEGLRSWQDADRAAETISPMMGIDRPVLSDARAAMGRQAAATVVLCMLEKISTIRSPGAYLRRLAQKARQGQFSAAPMVNALLQAQPRAAIVS